MKLAYWVLLGAMGVGTSACAAETDDAHEEEITDSAESELSASSRDSMRDVGGKIRDLHLQFTHPQSNRLVVFGPSGKMDDLVDYVKKKHGHVRLEFKYAKTGECWEFWWGAKPKPTTET